jgi:hypothetical protein
METRAALNALISDLQWQLDQFGARGVKNPAHQRRGLQNAIDDGGLAVVEFVRSYLHKTPCESFKRLGRADALELTNEALVADDTRPYAQFFTDEDRAAARQRLAPHLETIEARMAERRARIEAQRKKLRARGLPRRSELDARIRARRGF